MPNTAEIWIVDKDKVLAQTLASMLVVNELVDDYKIFKSLKKLKKEFYNNPQLPKAILAENRAKENYWEFATEIKKQKVPTSIYLMGKTFKNEDIDAFENASNIKRLFKTPLRLDELKWMMEELG